MGAPYTLVPGLADQILIPEEGILTRPIHEDGGLKAVLFGFSAGQELSEHTASRPAVLHFLEGDAELRLGDDLLRAGPGTWVHMPAGLRHAIRARSPLRMLLLLLPAEGPS